MKDHHICPHCGKPVFAYRNPFPTVDILIEMPLPPGQGTPCQRTGVVLIRRKNPPYGWAIPGGFVDYGETLEAAAVREALEETSLKVEIQALLGAYSDPERDPRHHTISVVFIARGRGSPRASDDAAAIGVFDRTSLPVPLAFDHEKILKDYFQRCPGPA